MRTSLLLIFVILSNLVQGQEDYLITLEKDTLFGKVSIEPNTYYDEVTINNELEKDRFKVYQVINIRLNGDLYDPISFGNKKVFGKRLIKGRLSHYAVRSEGESGYYDEILLKENEESLIISKFGFANRASDFLSDCNEVENKIENKIFKYSDISTIVNHYNEVCND